MPRTFANIHEALRGEIIFHFDYPADLRALIVKCCSQNPSDRPCFEDIRKALWRVKVWNTIETVNEFAEEPVNPVTTGPSH